MLKPFSFAKLCRASPNFVVRGNAKEPLAGPPNVNGEPSKGFPNRKPRSQASHHEYLLRYSQLVR